MLNPIFRNLCSGLICVVLALSQRVTPATIALAQNDDPPPTPPAAPLLASDSFEKELAPWAPSAAEPKSVYTSSITSTLEFQPPQAVRDILEKGRAILYPGHVLTPTEIAEDTSGNQNLPARSESENDPLYIMISGTVIVSDTGLPMGYVRVDIYSPSGSTSSELTNRLGKFSRSFSGPGPYRVRVDPSQVYPYDLAGEWYDDQPLSNTATLITPTIGAPPILIALDRGSQITGTIVASDTGAPLAGMTLAVYDANGTFLHSVLSDDAGHFTSGGLRSGSYTVCAYAYSDADSQTRLNYPGGCYRNADTPTTATPLTVTSPNPLPDITVAVPYASQITGVVTAAGTGLPLAGVEIDVLGKNGTFGSYTRTDNNGQYVVSGLRAGSYIVYFATHEGSSELDKYESEYYDSKPRLSSADVITLATSITISNVNATLDVAGSITGVVTAEDTNAPLSNVRVVPIGPPGTFLHETWTNARGEYTLSNMPAGSYKMYFSTSQSSISTTRQYFGQYYNDSFSQNTAASISVTVNLTTSGVNVTLDRGGQITGVVTGKDTGLGLVHVLVDASRIELYNVYYYLDSFRAATYTDPQGHYTLTVAGGLNTVSFRPYFSFAPYCGQFYNLQVVDKFANPVPVIPGHTSPNINGILDHTSGISGTVIAADSGAPLARVSVLLQFAHPFNNEYQRFFTTTDQQGHYSLGPLCPGVYKLRFDPTYGPTQTALYAPNYFDQKLTDDTSDEFMLTAGITLTANSALIRRAFITGTVRAGDSGIAIDDAYVHVVDLNGNAGSELGYTRVSADGTYSLGVTPGRYKLHLISRFSDYASEYFSATASFRAATTIEVTPTQVLSNINFLLQHGGVIMGTVTDENTGDPLPYAYIAIFDRDNPNIPVTEVEADQYGIYRTTTRLHAGQYIARISRYRYLSKYFGGGSDFSSASPITVTDGLTTTNASVSLLSIQSPKLSTQLRFPIVMRSIPGIPVASLPFLP